VILTVLSHGLNPLLQAGPIDGPAMAQWKRIQEVKISGSDEVCAICQDKMPMSSKAVEMPCEHRFHEDCLERHLEERADCPLCRSDL